MALADLTQQAAGLIDAVLHMAEVVVTIAKLPGVGAEHRIKSDDARSVGRGFSLETSLVRGIVIGGEECAKGQSSTIAPKIPPIMCARGTGTKLETVLSTKKV